MADGWRQRRKKLWGWIYLGGGREVGDDGGGDRVALRRSHSSPPSFFFFSCLSSHVDDRVKKLTAEFNTN
jgi:hypothetical protein